MKRTDKRHSPFRRQINEAFCDPNGAFSVGKFLAVWSQIAVLAHMNHSWDVLLGKPESLMIVLTFLIAPDSLKKFLALKYGNGTAK